MSFQITVAQGNITRDIDLKQVGATHLAKFAVAISRKYKGKSEEWIEDVLFLDVAVWGAQALSCAKYLAKGSSVLVQGTLKNEEWTDAKTNAPKNRIVLYADKVVFLGNKRTNENNNSDEQAPMPFGKENQHLKNATPEGQGLIDMNSMGLPF